MIAPMLRQVGLTIGLFIAVLFCGPVWAGEWEKMEEDTGITSFRKEIEGSPFKAFRGEALVDAPIEKVLWVLADNRYRPRWVDRLEVSKTLEKKGDYEYVVFQYFGLPWPVADREYVYRGRAFSKGSEVILEMASTQHPKAPKAKGVRGTLKQSRYVLVPKGPNQTHVTVEILTDPRGMLPSWLVNLIQKSWPIKTPKGIRKMVDQPFAKTLAVPPGG